MVSPGKVRVSGFADLRENPALSSDHGKSRARMRSKYDAPKEDERKRLRRVIDQVKQSLAPFYRDNGVRAGLFASVPAAETITKFLDGTASRGSRIDVSELRKVLYALGVSSEDSAFVLETLDAKRTGAIDSKVFASTFLPGKSPVRGRSSVYDSSDDENNTSSSSKVKQLPRERQKEPIEAFHQRVIERVQVRYSSVKDAFRQYDTNRVGVLSPTQFRSFMRDLGFVGSDVEALIRHLDRNGQAISFNAFANGVNLSTGQSYAKTSPKKKTMQPLRSSDAASEEAMMDPMERIRAKLRQRVIGRNKSIREVFIEFDTDGNGCLDHDEFKRFMAAYNFTPSEAMVAIEFLDQDYSGTIDYDEFANGLLFYRPNPALKAQQRPAPMTEAQRDKQHGSYILEVVRERLASTTQRLDSSNRSDNPLLGLRDEFAKFDSDNSGALDYQEFSAFLISVGVKLSPRDLDSLLLVVDQDRSQQIEFHEFASIFSEKSAGGATTKSPLKNPVLSPPKDRQYATQPQSHFSVSDNGLAAVFNKYDIDQSGQLDYAEFSQLMRDHGFSQGDIVQVMKQIDQDRIDLDTFKSVVNARGWKMDGTKATRKMGPVRQPVAKGKSAIAGATNNSGAAEAMLVTRILRDHQSLEEAFRQHDVDGSGELDHDEFRRLMKHYGVRDDEEISRLISKLDADASGTVSLDEFLARFQAKPTKARAKVTQSKEATQRHAAMQELKQLWVEELLAHHDRLEDAFREHDRDKRNELDHEQFRDLMAQYGVSDDSNVRHFLSELDTDSSGTVSLEEFVAAFQPIASRLKKAKTSSDPKAQQSKTKTSASSLATQQAKANGMRMRLLEEQWIKRALDQHGSIREAFASFDADGSGALDHSEFSQLMKAHGITREDDIASMIKRLDLDGSGAIDYDEFATLFHAQGHGSGVNTQPPIKRSSLAEPTAKAAHAARLRDLEIKWIKRALTCHASIEAAFAEYDRDGNGTLDHDEFSHCMKRYGIVRDDDIARLIRRLDLDNSGTIDVNEFLTVFNPLRCEGYSASVAHTEDDDGMDQDELASVLEIERELAERILKSTRDMRLAFRKFDANGNGKLEYSEFRQVLKAYKFPEPEIRKVIRHLDRDVSGWIDYREFMTSFSHGKTKRAKSKRASLLTKTAAEEGDEEESMDTLKKRLLESVLRTYGTVQSAFRKYDTARNGCLSPVQFESMLVALGFDTGHASRLLTQFDRDQSGTIEYQEFLSELIGEQTR